MKNVRIIKLINAGLSLVLTSSILIGCSSVNNEVNTTTIDGKKSTISSESVSNEQSFDEVKYKAAKEQVKKTLMEGMGGKDPYDESTAEYETIVIAGFIQQDQTADKAGLVAYSSLIKSEIINNKELSYYILDLQKDPQIREDMKRLAFDPINEMIKTQDTAEVNKLLKDLMESNPNFDDKAKNLIYLTITASLKPATNLKGISPAFLAQNQEYSKKLFESYGAGKQR